MLRIQEHFSLQLHWKEHASLSEATAVLALRTLFADGANRWQI